MTQIIFDVENEKDMALLWSILPDWARKIKKSSQTYNYDVILSGNENYAKEACIFKINWHNKTEITRPIQEATKEDFKKLCLFRNDDSVKDVVGVLSAIDSESVFSRYYMAGGTWWAHCRRLTKQEIEELC